MTPSDRVSVRGVELAVRDQGSGTPVVWGHGLTSSMAHEDEIGLLDLRLDADRFRTIRYDARGHGESTGTTETAHYRYEQLAVDQRGLLDALGLDQVVLGGASMGAVTAVHTAVEAADQVLALVLAIPPTAWEDRVERGSLYAAGGDLIEAVGVEPFIELATGEAPPEIFADVADDMATATAARYRAFDPAVLAAVLRGIGGSDLPDRGSIEAVDAPTLVLSWGGDPAHPRATAEELHRLLPNSELAVADSLAEVSAWPDRVRGFLDGVIGST